MDVIALAHHLPSIVLDKTDDDFSDRLNYRYTTALLLVFAIVVFSRQYGGGDTNIVCWIPAHFTSVYNEYVSKICWVSNAYYNERDQDIYMLQSDKKSNEIKYYQWAFLFYIPRIFWKTSSCRSGMDISNLVESGNSYKSIDGFDKRSEYMKYLVSHIDQYVDHQRRYDTNRTVNRLKRLMLMTNPCAGRYLGNYIVILYLITKIIYIFNNILQIWLLSELLGKNFLKFGFEFITNLWKGQGWSVETKYFPKVALCDFAIREVGNLNKSHQYTVQCVLPVNLFNQQIFILIWFWYLIVLLCNIGGIFRWISKSLPIKSSKFIFKRVLLFNAKLDRHSFKLKHFIEKYLEPDGIFMIQILANNTNDFVASDLVQELWKLHYKKYYHKFHECEPQDANGIELPEHIPKHCNNQTHVFEYFQ